MSLVDDPEEADAVLWLVWDYSLCIASGVEPLEWERGKARLTSSCPAHAALLKWLQSRRRWRRRGGRDHAFIIDDPSRWQSPFAIPFDFELLPRWGGRVLAYEALQVKTNPNPNPFAIPFELLPRWGGRAYEALQVLLPPIF